MGGVNKVSNSQPAGGSVSVAMSLSTGLGVGVPGGAQGYDNDSFIFGP